MKTRRAPLPDQLIVGHPDPARGQKEDARPDEPGAGAAKPTALYLVVGAKGEAPSPGGDRPPGPEPEGAPPPDGARQGSPPRLAAGPIDEPCRFPPDPTALNGSAVDVAPPPGQVAAEAGRWAAIEPQPEVDRSGGGEGELALAPPSEPTVRPGDEGVDDRRLRRLTTAGVAIAATAAIALTRPGAWILVAVLLLGLSTAWRPGALAREVITAVLGVAVAATAVDYLAWRSEVANWGGWEIAGPLLVAEMFGALHVLGLQYTIWPRSPQPVAPPGRSPDRPIFILIPTVNEGPAVLGPTIRGAQRARRWYLRAFPQAQVKVVVCNDARVAGLDDWRAVKTFARRMRVRCITRTVGGGNKAGNLEHARQQLGATGDALVAIFDADQVPRPEFLLKTVPHFADLGVGWVQTGQYYGNLEQPVARWANDQQALFYRVLAPGKAAHNAAFICGTNVVIRADALDEIGGLPQDSVTEDFLASIELHPRWRSVFLTDVLAVGLGPMDLPAYLRQQQRWATGTIGVLRTHWRQLLLPQRQGLRLEQRFQYLLASTHYLCGVRDLIYVAAPLAFLLTGIPAVRSATLALFLWHFLPYLIASQLAFVYAGRRATGVRGIILGFGSFPVLLRALSTVVLGRQASFMVTAKRRRRGRSWQHVAIHLVMLVACFAAVAVALAERRLRPESMAISILWVAYDVALIGGFLWLAARDLSFKEASPQRSGARNRYPVRLGGAWRRPAWASGLRVANAGGMSPWRRVVFGAGAVAVTLGVEVPVMVSTAQNIHPMSLAAERAPGQSPLLGLTLPYGVPLTEPQTVAGALCLPFGIVGRTQDISGRFDTAWANQLAAHGERPWIILQFGELGANGSAPLNASLPAIMNGLRDAAIRRWAGEIGAYGKPVYLTILPQVDKNWAVSSAVSRGGIPEDVPRAWEHVQAIFKAAGDTNVAWVWAPADPAHDQAYAPPSSTIDAVLQDLIRYPGTPWPDPATVLAAVSRRHPHKPILLEVSAAGAPAAKAAWLERVATAVAETPQVFALTYRDGSPALHPTAAENRQWSLESDPSTVGAAVSWQALDPTRAVTCRSSLAVAR